MPNGCSRLQQIHKSCLAENIGTKQTITNTLMIVEEVCFGNFALMQIYKITLIQLDRQYYQS